MTAALAPEKSEGRGKAGGSGADDHTEAPGIGAIARAYAERVRGGELGALPAVLGLVVLCAFFAILRPVFLSELNFANLLTQGAGSIAIAMGLVFLLLLGEIDLSAGYASGVCAAVLAILLTNHGWPWYGAVTAAMLTGVAIGLLLGTLVAKVGIPSFVVTLAAFLGFQGIVLILLKEGTNISIEDKTILAIANNNLSPALGWVLLAVCVAAYAAVQFRVNGNRRSRGLTTSPPALIALRLGTAIVLGGLAVYLLNQERSRNVIVDSLKGVPIVVPVIGALLVIGTFVLQRTSFGLHIYAVGGSAEGPAGQASTWPSSASPHSSSARPWRLSAASSPPPAATRWTRTPAAATFCCSRWAARSSAAPVCSAVAGASSTPSWAAWWSP